MKKSRGFRHPILNVIVWTILLEFGISVNGANIQVPSQYPTIQAAIDAANTGDVVLIANGIYTGAGNYGIDFLGKAITVRGVGGAGACTIDCQGQIGFHFRNNENASSVLEGISIINGSSNFGIKIENSSPLIKNSSISGSKGLFVDGGFPRFEACTFDDNIGCGIVLNSCAAEINGCTIINNRNHSSWQFMGEA